MNLFIPEIFFYFPFSTILGSFAINVTHTAFWNKFSLFTNTIKRLILNSILQKVLMLLYFQNYLFNLQKFDPKIVYEDSDWPLYNLM